MSLAPIHSDSSFEHSPCCRETRSRGRKGGGRGGKEGIRKEVNGRYCIASKNSASPIFRHPLHKKT